MSDPDLNHVHEALATLDHLVVHLTETSFSTPMLCCLGLGRRPGRSPTPTAVFARPAVASPGDARLDWWIIQQIAQGMVVMPFCYTEAAENLLTNSTLDPFGKIPEFTFCAARMTSVAAHAA
jgi:predicted molibdopterin-dependent oxidoreductase YjgC